MLVRSEAVSAPRMGDAPSWRTAGSPFKDLVPKFLGVLNQPVFDNGQRSRFDLRLRAWG
jgi:hypothetical protein